MSRPVYVSSNCLRDRTPSAIRRAVELLGISRLELSAVQASPPEACQLALELRRDGVEVLLHNYFPPAVDPFVLNLCSPDRLTLRRSREHCARAMELSAELGAPFFAAHAGLAMELPAALLGRPKEQREFCLSNAGAADIRRAQEVFLESVADLVAKGQSLGVEFLIENHVAAGGLEADTASKLLLGLSAAEILGWAKELPEFGLLLDVGHLRCTARTMNFVATEFCAEIRPLVKALHLSDNDGRDDEHRPFDRSSWFWDFLPMLPDIPATLEFDACSPRELALARSLFADEKL